MNGYWNFITVAHCPQDAAHGELGEANLGLVSAQPKSTRRTLAGLLSQVALGWRGMPGCGWPLRWYRGAYAEGARDGPRRSPRSLTAGTCGTTSGAPRGAGVSGWR